MSGLLSIRRAAAPRHAAPRGPSRAPQQVNQSSVALAEPSLSIVPDDLSIVQPVARPVRGPAGSPRLRQSRRGRLDFQRRLQLSRAGLMATNVGLVIGAVILLFGAVFLLLVAANWAADREHSPATSSSTVY